MPGHWHSWRLAFLEIGIPGASHARRLAFLEIGIPGAARTIACKFASPGCRCVSRQGATPLYCAQYCVQICAATRLLAPPGKVRHRNIARNIACRVVLPHGWKGIPARCDPAILRAPSGKVRPRNIAQYCGQNCAARLQTRIPSVRIRRDEMWWRYRST